MLFNKAFFDSLSLMITIFWHEICTI